MKDKTLIISVIHGLGWGAESVLEEYLFSNPTDLVVCAPQDSRIARVAQKCNIDYLPWGSKKDCFRENMRMATKLRLPDNITRIHGWCLRSVESAWLLSMLNSLPWTFGLHDSPMQPYHSFMRRKTIYAGAKYAQRLVTVSEAMKKECMEIGLPSSPHVIPNGIRDLAPASLEFTSDRQDIRKKVVGFLGMNTPHKGFSVVKEWIQATDCDWRLYGELFPKFRIDLDELEVGCPGRVIYRGRQDNQNLYAELDLVVMPSRSFESFGLVALEASRAGIPVVAANIGGLSEVVSHQESGYLFKPADTEQGLQYIRLLLEDSHLRLKMGQQARQRFLSKFTAEQMAEKWNAFFRECRI